MTDDRLIAASDTNFYEGWRSMAAVAGGFIHEGDGILIAAPGVGPVWLNLVFVTQPLRDPEAQLAGAFALLDARSVPFFVRVRDGLDPAAEIAAESLGLKYTDSIPGMALDPIPVDGGRDADLDIREVMDDAAFSDFAAVTAASFDLGESGPQLLPPVMRTVTNTHWYVGYKDGEPVAASSLERFDDVAGINFIGTLAAHRGRGYGEAMTWRVVNRGKEEGCELAVLQASEAGQPVYERMGFRTVTGYKTFVRPQWIG